MRYRYVFLAILGLGLPLAAQQVGDTNRNYEVNHQGGFAYASPAPVNVITGVLNQFYYTQDPTAPVILAADTAVSIGYFTTPTNSVDLNLTTAQIVANGLEPGFLSSFFWTDGIGVFSMHTGIPPLPAGGFQEGAQIAHIAASSPDGWWISQAHDITFPALLGCNYPGTNIGAGDDTSTEMPLGFSYTYYGTSYTSLFVGSNGYLTFGAPYTSPAGLSLTFPPAGMELWATDLDPSVPYASVNFYTDNVGVVEVCFLDVPEPLVSGMFGIGANRFRITLDNQAGTISMSYDAFMTAGSGTVGVTGGNGTVPLGLDLSLGPNTITPGMAAFEWFDDTGFGGTPNDLQGSTIVWTLDANGNPISEI